MHDRIWHRPPPLMSINGRRTFRQASGRRPHMCEASCLIALPPPPPLLGGPSWLGGSGAGIEAAARWSTPPERRYDHKHDPSRDNRPPDFELPRKDGRTVKALSDFRANPVVVILLSEADTPGCYDTGCGVRRSPSRLRPPPERRCTGDLRRTVRRSRSATKSSHSTSRVADCDNAVAEMLLTTACGCGSRCTARTYMGNERIPAFDDRRGR